MKKRILALTLALSMAFATTGCIKVVKIGEEGALTGEVKFNATDNVAELWDAAVENLEKKAVELPKFFEEAKGDMASLVDKYGKYSMGTSGTISYAVKGSGVVEEVNQEKKAGYMTVKVDGYDGPVVVKIQIGSIYKGSSTRDTLDIVNFGDFTNQQEWAAISQELHTLIDTNVVKPLDPANLVGKTVEFVGTFTVDGNDEMLITTIKMDAK